jgi:beta-glucanase (GH16 family)
MRLLLITGLCLVMAGCGGGNSVLPAPSPAAAGQQTWILIWSDEFHGPNGSVPDTTKWTYDIGGRGWGNNELETYTDRTQNARLQDGMLIIQALKETFAGSDGITRNYTSARLKAQDRFRQTYGRLEARVKIPYGQGIWPAFWMLGDNVGKVGWPNCGEIDIMENIGREPSIIHGTIHGPGYSGGSGISASYALPAGQRFADDFHIFAVD